MSQSRGHRVGAGPAASESQQMTGGSACERHGRLSFEVFAVAVREHVQDEVAEIREPNESFCPRGYIASEDRAAQILVETQMLGRAANPSAVAPRGWQQGLEAFLVEEIFPDIVRRENVLLFACAWSAFTTSPKPVSEMSEVERQAFSEGRQLPGWPSPERWRGREEALVMLLARDRQEAWQAPIVRPHGQPPAVGYWSTLGHDQPWERPAFRNLRRALRGEPADAGGH
jgi:hypothetical protein